MTLQQTPARALSPVAADDDGTPRERIRGFDVLINDRQNFHILCKDVFERRIYHFNADSAEPTILDCGANIGMSVLYFKHVYPEARIVAFEPDPSVARLLRRNVEANELKDVQIVEAALSDSDEPQTLHADGKYASMLDAHASSDARVAGTATDVRCVRLRDYLTEPVDFLKMNIEGAEWSVLRDTADRLETIRSMVIEYHHLPGLPRTLHHILALLDQLGFEYLINDFDDETNPHVRPPFRLTPRTSYYLLIHARHRSCMR